MSLTGRCLRSRCKGVHTCDDSSHKSSEFPKIKSISSIKEEPFDYSCSDSNNVIFGVKIKDEPPDEWDGEKDSYMNNSFLGIHIKEEPIENWIKKENDLVKCSSILKRIKQEPVSPINSSNDVPLKTVKVKKEPNDLHLPFIQTVISIKQEPPDSPFACEGSLEQNVRIKSEPKENSDEEKIRCAPPGEFRCFHCKRHFWRKYLIKQHMKWVHLKKQRKCTYEGCKYVTFLKKNLTTHIRAVHETVLFPCVKCKFSAKSYQALRLHMKNIHSGKKFECMHCNYTTPYRPSLKGHIEAVHLGLRHECPLCGHWSYRRSCLNEHIRSIHEGVRYPCPHCPYQATQRTHLRLHVRSQHEGFRYACPYCKHKTTQRSHLKVHVATFHEGARFPCPHCSYQARALSNLSSHIISIHEGVKHPCPQCKYAATQRSSLIVHMRSMHKISREEAKKIIGTGKKIYKFKEKSSKD